MDERRRRGGPLTLALVVVMAASLIVAITRQATPTGVAEQQDSTITPDVTTTPGSLPTDDGTAVIHFRPALTVTVAGAWPTGSGNATPSFSPP